MVLCSEAFSMKILDSLIFLAIWRFWGEFGG